jgi:hypothetical protein
VPPVVVAVCRMQANANRRPVLRPHTYVATSPAARLCQIKIYQPFRESTSWYGLSTMYCSSQRLVSAIERRGAPRVTVLPRIIT